MHAAGKVSRSAYFLIHTDSWTSQTDEARADLGRLAEIRKQREAAAARRVAEAEGPFGLSQSNVLLCADLSSDLQPRRRRARQLSKRAARRRPDGSSLGPLAAASIVVVLHCNLCVCTCLCLRFDVSERPSYALPLFCETVPFSSSSRRPDELSAAHRNEQKKSTDHEVVFLSICSTSETPLPAPPFNRHARRSSCDPLQRQQGRP